MAVIVGLSRALSSLNGIFLWFCEGCFTSMASVIAAHAAISAVRLLQQVATATASCRGGEKGLFGKHYTVVFAL